MTAVQTYNADLAQSLSTTFLEADQRNVSASFYDTGFNTVSYTINGMYLTTTRVNGDSNVYQTQTYNIKVNRAGLYHISWGAYFELYSGTSSSNVSMWCEQDTSGSGSAWSEASATRDYATVRNGEKVSRAGSDVFHVVTAPDLFRVRYVMTGGITTVRMYQTRMSLIKLQ